MIEPTLDLLVLGWGYSARHGAAALEGDLRSLVTTARDPAKADRLAATGLDVVRLAEPQADARLAAAVARASHILVSAGPSEAGDPFLARLEPAIRAAAAAGTLRWIGYLSTVGVYGNADGGPVNETTVPVPASDRTRWRIAAEGAWAALGKEVDVPVAVLRLAGIYGPGRNAFVNLEKGTARRIIKPGQMFNRIRVEDIGRAIAASAKARFDGILNVSDDEPAPPQLPIELAAQLMGVEPPPEIPFDAATFTPMALSFWGESKRVGNARLRSLIGDLTYPTYREGLTQLWEADTWRGDPQDQEDASPKFRR
ncbi:NAD(P)-dependent oxidoreductase [Pinisolibacter sp.]|uniref:NAD(P)-dependent oxidoreductase n=1 Tax=Pinisolibacter sp. TaxID=2172024 RepID=UPI002FDD1555